MMVGLLPLYVKAGLQFYIFYIAYIIFDIAVSIVLISAAIEQLPIDIGWLQ